MATTYTTGEIAKLVSELGLVASGDELFVGKKHGFPVGLKIISGENPLLLFQIRYPLHTKSKAEVKVNFDDRTKELISGNKIEISVEDSIAWVSIIDSNTLLRDESVVEVLDSVLNSLKDAGLCGQGDLCHYCQSLAVEQLTCANGKVAQICQVCLDKKQAGENDVAGANPARRTVAYALAPLASLVGAVGWVVAWLAFDHAVGLLNVRFIIAPKIVFVFAMLIVAVMVGGPVGFVLRKTPHSGGWLDRAAVIGFSIASVVLGEVLYVVWMIYGEYKVISFTAAFKVLPKFWADIGLIPLLERIVVAACSVVAAHHFARPKTKGVSF